MTSALSGSVRVTAAPNSRASSGSWAGYSLMWQRWLRGWSQAAIAGRSESWRLPFVVLGYGLASVDGAAHAD
jgi:hypothetical protein